jgi:hypothetical protein
MKNNEESTASQGAAPREFGFVSNIKILHGYGFIIGEDNRSYFFPFKFLGNGLIPKLGECVSFEVGEDGQGRSIASNVRIESGAK